MPYNTPHSPFQVPDRFWDKFKDRADRDARGDPKQEDLDATRCVLAMCENIDWNVGRVLAKLDELKLADNTIVVYFSDNGPNSWRWNGGMKGRKGSTDEGGVRVAVPGPLAGPHPAADHDRPHRRRHRPAAHAAPAWPGFP